MTVARNIIYDYASQVIYMFVALLQSVVLFRYLGKEQYGILSFVVLANSFTTLLISCSLAVPGMYFLGKNRERQGEINAIVTVCVAAVCLLLYSALAAFPGVGHWIAAKAQNPASPATPTKYLVLALALLPVSVYNSAWIGMMVGLGAIRKLAVYNSCYYTLQTIVYFAVVVGARQGISGFLHAWVVMSALHLCGMWLMLSSEGGVWARFTLRDFGESLFFALRAHWGNVASSIISRLDSIYANKANGPGGFAAYSRASSMFSNVAMGIDALERASYRTVTASEQLEAGLIVQRMMRNIIILSVAGILVLFPLARLILVTLYTKDVSEAVWPLRILLLSLPFFGCNRVLAMYVTGQLGKPHLSSLFTWLAVPVVFGLLAGLTPRYGLAGAAAAIAGTYVFLFLLFFSFFLFKTRLLKPADYFIPKPEDIRSFARYLRRLRRR